MAGSRLAAMVSALPTKETAMSTLTAPVLRETTAPVELYPPLVAVPEQQPGEAAEIRRWLVLLLPPFVVSAAIFAAAIGTGIQWLIGPALAIGPMLLILAFIYLG